MSERKTEVKHGIIGEMKFIAMLAFLPAVALGVTVGPLPPSEYADAEVSTNVSVSVDLAKMTRMEFSLSLDASPTNCVEVAVGTDADGDDDLALEEADWTIGFRCGVWFVRDAVGDGEVEVAAEGGRRLSRTFLLKKRNMSADWNLVKVVRRGVAEIGEVVMVQGLKRGIALEVR